MTCNIAEVLERFYICTDLSIIAYQLDRKFIESSGYNSMFIDLIEENNILDKALIELNNSDNCQIITITCSSIIHYTACLIDPKNIQSGLFILGPHSCIKNNAFNIPYKPKCLIKNLISLLYIIEKDINHCRHFKSSFSYHIKKGLDYIDNRYSEDISLIEVANYLNINKSYFCTLLKKEAGKTFTQVLNDVRIEKSKKLLLEDNSSMLDIALAVGYNNQNYYNITFKKITGMTPMEYRKVG